MLVGQRFLARVIGPNRSLHARAALVTLKTGGRAAIGIVTGHATTTSQKQKRNDRKQPPHVPVMASGCPEASHDSPLRMGAARLYYRDVMTSADLDRAFVWHPFTQMRDWNDPMHAPIVIVEGRGSVLKAEDGRSPDAETYRTLRTNIDFHKPSPEKYSSPFESLEKTIRNARLIL